MSFHLCFRVVPVCVSSFPVGFSGPRVLVSICPSKWFRERSAPSSVARVCRLTPLCTRTRSQERRKSLLPFGGVIFSCRRMHAEPWLMSASFCRSSDKGGPTCTHADADHTHGQHAYIDAHGPRTFGACGGARCRIRVDGSAWIRVDQSGSGWIRPPPARNNPEPL